MSKLEDTDTCDRCGVRAMFKLAMIAAKGPLHLTFCNHHGVAMLPALKLKGFAVTDARSGDD